MKIPIDLSDYKRIYLKTDGNIEHPCPKCGAGVFFKLPNMLYYGSASVTADCRKCYAHIEHNLSVKLVATLAVIDDI